MRQVKVTKLSKEGLEEITFVDLPEKIEDVVEVEYDNGDKKQKKKRIRKTS